VKDDSESQSETGLSGSIIRCPSVSEEGGDGGSQSSVLTTTSDMVIFDEEDGRSLVWMM
jgi:hypothetical protein